MVGINSFTGNREGVNRLGRFTAECFAPLGFTAEYVPSTNKAWGDHLVLTRRGRSARSIALISHLDTVFPPEEEARNNFRWQVEGDRIFGPGTHDIKGGSVMMWLVLTALRTHDAQALRGHHLEADLELLRGVLLAGLRRRLPRPLRPPARWRRWSSRPRAAWARRAGMVVARKGRGTWRVTVSGRGSHAGGKHEHGANAIVQLGRDGPAHRGAHGLCARPHRQRRHHLRRHGPEPRAARGGGGRRIPHVHPRGVRARQSRPARAGRAGRSAQSRRTAMPARSRSRFSPSPAPGRATRAPTGSTSSGSKPLTNSAWRSTARSAAA